MDHQKPLSPKRVRFSAKIQSPTDGPPVAVPAMVNNCKKEVKVMDKLNVPAAVAAASCASTALVSIAAHRDIEAASAATTVTAG